MRLTLRTLLAYLDDILDPQDQEDLTRQIETSDKASDLIHRTRDAMRRLRLGVPPVVGEGMEVDPNLAAEYLDNTMSPEAMTEYQQVCLDSDVHLAEVASCHHILTLVLGEPAEIDPHMRQRIYDVPQQLDEWRLRRLEGPHRGAGASPAEDQPALEGGGFRNEVASDGAAVASVPVVKSQVPDYLREPRQSVWRQAAMAVVAVALLVGVAYLMMRPDRDWGPQAKSESTPLAPGEAKSLSPNELALPANDPLSGEVARVEPSSPDASTEEQAGPQASMIESPESPASVKGPVENGMVQSAVPGLPADGEVAPAGPPGADLPRETGTLPERGFPETGLPVAAATARSLELITGAGESEMPSGAAPLGPAERAASVEGPAKNASEPVRVASMPGPLSPEVSPEEQTETEQLPPGASAGEAGSTGEAATNGPVTGPIPPLGRMLGAREEIVLRWQSNGQQWQRLLPRALLAAGDQLLALPTYRPSWALASGLQVELVGGTMVRLGTVDRPGKEEPTANVAAPPVQPLSAGEIAVSDVTAGDVTAGDVTAGDVTASELAAGPTSPVEGEAGQGTSGQSSTPSMFSRQMPSLEVLYGQALLMAAEELTRVELRIGDRTTLVELAPKAVLAIQVEYPFVAGKSVAAAGSVEPVVRCVAPQGGVVWDAELDPQSVEQAAEWSWGEGRVAMEPLSEQLGWLERQQLPYLDQRASQSLAILFDAVQPAGTQMVDFFQKTRRREERALTAQCAVHLGEFLLLLDTLADPDQQPNWEEHIALLRQTMVGRPEMAQQLYQRLGEQRGAEVADDLYTMLSGFSPDQIGTTREEVQQGVVPLLIDWLEHDQLDYRVLAFSNLREIFGGKTLNYNPATRDPARRKRAARVWRERLEEHELVPAKGSD